MSTGQEKTLNFKKLSPGDSIKVFGSTLNFMKHFDEHPTNPDLKVGMICTTTDDGSTVELLWPSPLHKHHVWRVRCIHTGKERLVLDTGLQPSSNHDEAINQELFDLGIMPPEQVLALTLWAEAREVPVGVMWVIGEAIYNRARRRSLVTGYPLFMSATEVCLAEGQFPCWKDGKFIHPEPDIESEAWDICWTVATGILRDDYIPEKVMVATHYYNFSTGCIPPWSKKMEFIGYAGNYTFFLDNEWRV